MIIFLKRVNIIIALILLFLTLGLIKFKNKALLFGNLDDSLV